MEFDTNLREDRSSRHHQLDNAIIRVGMAQNDGPFRDHRDRILGIPMRGSMELEE